MPDRVVNFSASRKKLLFRYQVFPQPLISTTITRCPANFINLSAIIEELRLAEHGPKFGRDLQIAINGVTRDVFKIPPKKEY